MTRRLVTNIGELRFLARMLNLTTTDLRLRLTTANFTPGQSLILANLTPPTFSGYADRDLVEGDWTVVGTGDQRASASYEPQVYEFTDAVTEFVRGAVIYDAADNAILTAELFDAPVEIEGTSSIEFTPRILFYDTADFTPEEA